MVERLRVGVEGGGCVARGLERLERLGLEPEELASGSRPASAPSAAARP